MAVRRRRCQSEIAENGERAILSRREVELYRRDFEVATVPILITDITDEVRDYVASNGKGSLLMPIMTCG